MSRDIETSIIIPTYNEKANIILLVDKIADLLQGHKMELIVVDDGSPDGTGQAVAVYAAQRPWLHVVHRKARPSLSGSVMDGLRLAGGEVLCVMDADLSHDPALLPKMIALVRQGVEVVVGSRRIAGGGVTKWPWHRRLLSSAGNYLAHTLLGLPIADTMSGYFAMARHFYDEAADYVTPRGYKILLEFCIRGSPRSIRELPYIFQDRRQGYSKFTIHTALEYLKMLIGLSLRRCINNTSALYHRSRYYQVLPFIKEGRVLDVGCGRPCVGMRDGAFLYFRDKEGMGLDYRPCHIKFPFVRALANRLPFKEHVFDTIVAMEIVEHLDESQLEAALQEFSRVITSNGRIIITTPNNSWLWKALWFFWRHTAGRKLWKGAHKLSYTERDWLDIFQRHFRVRRIERHLGILLVVELAPIQHS